jgi:hypothetical protein
MVIALEFSLPRPGSFTPFVAGNSRPNQLSGFGHFG